MHKLIRYWRKFEDNGSPCVLAHNREVLEEQCTIQRYGFQHNRSAESMSYCRIVGYRFEPP